MRKCPTLSKYVVDENGCWIYQGARFPDGYGSIGCRPAHRLFYQRLVGPIPRGYEIHHECGVRLCVNPQHLRPLTREEEYPLDTDGAIWDGGVDRAALESSYRDILIRKRKHRTLNGARVE